MIIQLFVPQLNTRPKSGPSIPSDEPSSPSWSHVPHHTLSDTLLTAQQLLDSQLGIFFFYSSSNVPL